MNIGTVLTRNGSTGGGEGGCNPHQAVGYTPSRVVKIAQICLKIRYFSEKLAKIGTKVHIFEKIACGGLIWVELTSFGPPQVPHNHSKNSPLHSSLVLTASNTFCLCLTDVKNKAVLSVWQVISNIYPSISSRLTLILQQTKRVLQVPHFWKMDYSGGDSPPYFEIAYQPLYWCPYRGRLCSCCCQSDSVLLWIQIHG